MSVDGILSRAIDVIGTLVKFLLLVLHERLK